MKGPLLIFFLLSLTTAAYAACSNTTKMNRQTSGICFTQILERTYYAQDHRVDARLRAGNGTACAWLKTTVDDFESGILSGMNGEIGLNFYESGDPNENVGFTYIPSLNQFRVNVFGMQVKFDVDLDRSVWNHLCYSWDDSNTVKLYVNATYVDSKNLTKLADVDGSKSTTYNVTNCFDRIGLWSPALTPDEISADACGRYIHGNIIRPTVLWCNNDTRNMNYEYIATKEIDNANFCYGKNKRQVVTQTTTAQTTLTTNTASSPPTTESSPGTTETSPGTTESSPQTTASSPGTTESSPGTTESSPGTTESTPGTTESSPGTTEASPGTIASNPPTTASSPQTTPSSPQTATSPVTPRDIGSSTPTTVPTLPTIIPSFNFTNICNQQLPFLNRAKDVFCNLLWVFDVYPRNLGSINQTTTPQN